MKAMAKVFGAGAAIMMGLSLTVPIFTESVFVFLIFVIGAISLGILGGLLETVAEMEAGNFGIFLAAAAPAIVALALSGGCNVQAAELADTPEQIQEEIYQGELTLLAALVHAEAEGEDMEGKRLVADAVLNRVDAPEFPCTISGVIYQTNAFSPVQDGRLEEAFFEVNDSDYAAVRDEIGSRQNRSVLYFTAGRYSAYGTPLFKHGGHYFSGR